MRRGREIDEDDVSVSDTAIAAGDNRGNLVPKCAVKIVRIEVRLLLPHCLRTAGRLGRAAIKVVDAAIDVVTSDEMFRSIGFIVTVNAFGGGISRDSRSGQRPDLMNAD